MLETASRSLVNPQRGSAVNVWRGKDEQAHVCNCPAQAKYHQHAEQSVFSAGYILQKLSTMEIANNVADSKYGVDHKMVRRDCPNACNRKLKYSSEFVYFKTVVNGRDGQQKLDSLFRDILKNL